MRFEDKVVIVTGAGSGIGAATARRFHAEGAVVALCGRRPAKLAEVGALLKGDRHLVLPTDVTVVTQVEHLVAETLRRFGRIDVVVNNAGYGVFASVEEAADEQIRRVIDTNLLGSINVIRAALPHLRTQRQGRILQVSTAGGQTTYPSFGYYHASKWGIEGFCETVAREIAPFGISLTIIEPGATPTGFGSSLDTAPAMPEYANTPAGEVRRARDNGTFPLPNDPRKIASAMIDLVDTGAAPLRLPLGLDTYNDVRATLVARLAEHDAHRDVALSVARGEAR